MDRSSIVLDATELFRSGTPGPQVTPIFYCQCPSLWGSLTTFRSLLNLTGISVLTARTRTLIHPRPFQVNQIALRRIISRLGRPSARFVLTRSRPQLPVRRLSRTPLVGPSSSAASLHSRARQPVGTSSAHIPRSVVPNSRRVRWLSASVSPGHGVLRPRISTEEVIPSSRFEPAGT